MTSRVVWRVRTSSDESPGDFNASSAVFRCVLHAHPFKCKLTAQALHSVQKGSTVADYEHKETAFHRLSSAV
ncbi:unnamed protein product [Soboliphyme baturini]|uniref:Uncharacterized protein n=1 Tax=Soboliphyme baturini TaxID=241478 RepID=A0A183J7H4_9BILA|nr:unnamed protein product [Soboliphyme baturini]